jgi:hypothetical protein
MRAQSLVAIPRDLEKRRGSEAKGSEFRGSHFRALSSAWHCFGLAFSGHFSHMSRGGKKHLPECHQFLIFLLYLRWKLCDMLPQRMLNNYDSPS